MKKFLSLMLCLSLLIPCCCAAAEETAPQSHILVVYFSATGTTKGVAEKLAEGEKAALRSVLKEDPRPAYQDDPERVYGFGFGGRQIRFRVRDGILTVIGIERE